MASRDYYEILGVQRGAEAAKTALEQPVTDALAEGAGIFAEAVVRVKKPEVAKYAPIASIVGEGVCYWQASQPKIKREERDAYRLAANGFRGVRARWSVEMADKAAQALFA